MQRKCLDCCCGSPKEVELCPVKDCALYPYRFGKRPGAGKRKMTPARLEALRRANEARIKRQDSGSPSQGFEEKSDFTINED
jgi:hypothetical protein